MMKISSEALADLSPDVFGIELERERIAYLAAEFAPILTEISKLRQLDLSEIHPVVTFNVEAE